MSPGSEGYCFYNDVFHSLCSVPRTWNTVVHLEGQQGLLGDAVRNVILSFLTFYLRVFIFLYSFFLFCGG